MMTSEQLTVNPDVGSIDAFGPINYKIPGIRNIPKDFNVSLLKEAAGGHKDLYSSKVGLLHLISPVKSWPLQCLCINTCLTFMKICFILPTTKHVMYIL